MDKKIFAFFLLFSLVLFLGCIGGNKEKKTEEVSTGTLNATILINGKETNNLVLVSGQSAQIGLRLKNVGSRDIFNATGFLIGCLESEETDKYDIAPNGEQFFSWTVRAPVLGTSEIIKCPTTIRICFDSVSKGYTELIFIPETYNDVIPAPNYYSSGDFLKFTYNAGAMRVICNKTNGECNVADPSINNMVIAVYTRNIGPGWVDYRKYSNGLAINTLKKLSFNLSGDNVEIIKFGELSKEQLDNWLSDDGKYLEIKASEAGDYKYLLKLVQGKELYSRIVLNVKNPDAFQDGLNVYTLNSEADYGYCVDVATINVELRGR
ncbi:MAG: hypothetical protein J7K22_00250 [Nanoarchaeota archaeon]|nr:hypothetical protein [Nanoarchaeota archaeon]